MKAMKADHFKYKKPASSKLFKRRHEQAGECISIKPEDYTGDMRTAPAPAERLVLPVNRETARLRARGIRV